MDIAAHLRKRGITLTPSQLQGLSPDPRPTLLLAVPGSGKTTVLVARAAALSSAGIPAEKVLNLTFSRSSASDMSRRFSELFGELFPKPPRFSTVHSFCFTLLREFSRQTGRPLPTLTGSDGAPSSSALLRRAAGQLSDAFVDEETLEELESALGYAKNRLLPPEEIPLGASPAFPKIRARYEAEKRAEKLMDYDDMPLFTLQILKSRPAFLEAVRSRFSRINVDEAQDLSPAQHALLQLLSPKGQGLFLVGDEDQSIYGFRGASPEELLRFAESFPGAQVLKMEDSFRSRPEILSCSSTFISLCPQRYDKRPIPRREKGGLVQQVFPRSMEDALAETAALLKECTGRSVGVLFRNNLSIGPLALFLTERQIPFRAQPEPSTLCRGPIAQQAAFLRLCARPYDLDAFRLLRFPGELSGELFEDVILRADGCTPVPELLRAAASRHPDSGPARKLSGLLKSCKDGTPGRNLEIFEQRTLLGSRILTRLTKSDATLRLLEEQFRYFCRRSHTYDELECQLKQSGSPVPFRPEEASVTLSTIHGAKGLEYDVVLLMDAFDGILPGRTALEDLTLRCPEAYYEEMRLFYVAATRARERLILFSPPKNAAHLRDSRFFHDFFRHTGNPSPAPSVPPGARITHKAFGSGTVEQQDGDTLEIRFSDGSLRKLSAAYCVRHHLIVQ